MVLPRLLISYWNKMKKYFEISFSSCPNTAQPYLDFIGHKKVCVFIIQHTESEVIMCDDIEPQYEMA